MTERFHVVWRVYPQLDLVQMSGILSGLGTLARRGVLSLSVDYRDDIVEVPYSLMEFVVTDRVSGATRNVVFDFYDSSAKVTPSALTFADRYFKRQYSAETAAAVSAQSASKIVPLGLTIAGYSRDAFMPVLKAVYGSLRSASARKARPTLKALLRHAYSDARLWYTLPSSDSPVLRDSDVKIPRIVFQPRYWPTTEGSGDVFDVANADRIATIRALRKAFPEDRTIGFMRTAGAGHLSSELLLDEHVTTALYHRQLRTSDLAVNCLGLSGSVGWKFSEYLAAGNAIVSQPIEKECLSPIEENVHYLAYHSPDECVAQCLRVRNDPALAARMRDVNRAYYQQWINPPAHVLYLLNRTFV